MTFRAIRGSRPGTTRRGLTVGAVAAVGFLAAGCSAVDPRAERQRLRSGSASASGSADADTFGTPASADQVKHGGTLVMALSAEPDQLDPTLSRSLYSRYVFHAMCEKLYDVDQYGADRAAARHGPAHDRPTAAGPSPSRCAQGVKFADGTPFDAAAVKATLNAHLTLDRLRPQERARPHHRRRDPGRRRPSWSSCKKPFAPLTAALADRAGMIISPKALPRRSATNFATAPVCVGPFKFAKRVPQNSIEVVKDPNYYDAAKVHLDKITYRIITDASIRVGQPALR